MLPRQPKREYLPMRRSAIPYVITTVLAAVCFALLLTLLERC